MRFGKQYEYNKTIIRRTFTILPIKKFGQWRWLEWAEYKGYYWDDYDLCTCEKTEPVRVWKDLYTRDCTCAHGKRYLMFISLYTELHEVLSLQSSKPQNEMMLHIIDSGLIDTTYTGLKSVDY